MRELAEFLVVEMGLRAPGQAHELIDNVADRSINDKRYAINDAKLKALGWTAERKWEEGIRETIEWYRHLSVFPPISVSFEPVCLSVCLSVCHDQDVSCLRRSRCEPPGGSLA